MYDYEAAFQALVAAWQAEGLHLKQEFIVHGNGGVWRLWMFDRRPPSLTRRKGPSSSSIDIPDWRVRWNYSGWGHPGKAMWRYARKLRARFP